MRNYELRIEIAPLKATLKAGSTVQNRSTVKDYLTVHSLAASVGQSVVKESLTTQKCKISDRNQER